MSPLLDDALSPEEAERAWRHVAGCSRCQGLVQRETWLKARLGALSSPSPCGPRPAPSTPPAWVEETGGTRTRRRALAVAGVGSLGAAVLGLAAFSGAPAANGGEDPVGAVTADLASVVTSSVASASEAWRSIAR